MTLKLVLAILVIIIILGLNETWHVKNDKRQLDEEKEKEWEKPKDSR